MQLFIVAVGHKMPAWIETGFAEYAKRKSTAEGLEAAAPKSKSKHLAANQEQEEAKPVRERKPAARKTAAAADGAAKPARKAAAKKIPTGGTVKVAVPKAAAAEAKAAKAAKAAAPKRTKAAAPAAEGAAPAKKVIRRIKKTEE